MDISKISIKNLRAEAHRLKLKPVVTVGQHGLSDNVHHEIDSALTHHELLKIRIPGQQKDDKKAMVDAICSQHKATLIQSIGNVVILFRLNQKNNRYSKFLDKSAD